MRLHSTNSNLTRGLLSYSNKKIQSQAIEHYFMKFKVTNKDILAQN